MNLLSIVPAGAFVGVAFLAASAHGVGPFGATLVSYAPGSNPNPAYLNPLTVLGEPERFTGEGVFPSCVTPFNPAFGTDEIVSLGTGGSLVIGFDHPVTDDPQNPFGVDLLVFGNAFLADDDFPNGHAVGLGGNSIGGRIEVSADGIDWRLVPGIEPDGLFPTLGYNDLTDPYATVPGAVLTDFTRPVDPAFNPINRTYADIRAAYAGSGGGAGVDIGITGLTQVLFVRISNSGSSSLEVDALSDVSPVPAPALPALGLFYLLASSRPRRSPVR